MMGTSFQTRAALSAASAAVLTALTVAVAPTAHAAAPFAGVASTYNGTKVGTSANQPTEDAAINAAKSNCNDPGCNFTFVIESPNCGSLGWSTSGDGEYNFDVRPTKAAAEQSQGTGFKLAASLCASG
jgi:hypothetical protein